MTKSCSICAKDLSTSRRGPQCGKCRKWFHLKCADISAGDWKALKSADALLYTCRDCSVSMPTRLSIVPDNASCSSVTQDDGDGVSLSSSGVFTLLKALRNDFKSIKSDINEMKDSQAKLMESVKFCCDKIDDFEKRIDEFNLKVKKIDKVEAKVMDLEKKLEVANEKIDEMEQYSRSNSCEIQGLVEKEGENLVALLNRMGTLVNCSINPAEIDTCHRVKKFNDNSPRPKSVIAKFVSKYKKDEFIAAVRSRRGISTKDLGLSTRDDGNIFVNEHLTSKNKYLFKLARDIAREKGFKFVWVRDARILMRKHENSRVIRISSQQDLERL